MTTDNKTTKPEAIINQEVNIDQLVMPTAWKFVWNDSGRFFSSLSKQTIEAYAKGAFSAHGKNCGRIEPVFDLDPYIVEGKS